MTQRDSAAIQRTADRLIRQVSDILLNHGELLAWAVHEPQGSNWVQPPVEQRIGKWFHFATYFGDTVYVWPDSLNWEKKPVQLFDGICHGLSGLLSSQLSRLPDSLAGWLGGNPDDALAQWVWFVSGFATTSLPRREPRIHRKCWGNDGVSFFAADKLESLRNSLPDVLRERMPPNADCWLVEVKTLLQTTIEAVEYLAELSYEAPTPMVATGVASGEVIADATPDFAAELIIPQCSLIPIGERTFANLFFEVSCADTDNVIADADDAKGHWRHAHLMREVSARRRADYPKWPGVDRLRLEIESAGDLFNRAGLIKWRARYCLANGIDTDAMNATKLRELASRLDNRTDKKIAIDEHTEGDGLADLKPSERKAYLAHEYAETKEGRRLTDREAWEYLDEHGIGDDGDELSTYDLPLSGTYADYMNRARRKLGEPKYAPRGQRSHRSRSIQKRSEI